MFQPVFHFLERFGNVVGRFILSVIYWVAVGPVAIFYRLFEWRRGYCCIHCEEGWQ